MDNTQETREPVGIACPACGCRHLLVYHTRKANRRIVRYRKCRHCGRTMVTSEKVTG